MTPGQVSLKVVGDRLALARQCLADLEALGALGRDAFENDCRNPAAADSFLRRAIEALFDAARHVLAKRHGLAGLEYREVARLVAEHGIVTDGDLPPRLLKIAGFRNRLAHYYDEVTPAELFGVIIADLGDLRAFAREIEVAAGRQPAKALPE